MGKERMKERLEELNDMTLFDIEMVHKLFNFCFDINDGKIVGVEGKLFSVLDATEDRE